MKTLKLLLLLAASLAYADHPLYASETVSNELAETSAQHDARMQWWRNAKFGMFIHWGLYSEYGGIYRGKHVGAGEWIMYLAHIPINEYAASAKQFDPTNFDADAWVSLAKEAGMKYIVFTAKHHDGFAMFHSAVDTYNLYDATPFHRDPVKELAEACAKRGIKLGLDYSQAQDWHHPGGGIVHHGVKMNAWDAAQVGSYDDYLNNVSIPQIRELLSNYGPVSEFWFDTPVGITPERAELIRSALRLQPQGIINNRLGGGDKGDFQVMERHVPGFGIEGKDFETCMNMNGSWGYDSYKTNFVSTDKLLHDLISVVSRGGNYLLDVGPDSAGDIPAQEVERLKAIGTWLDKNGEAIYGTTGSPLSQDPSWGRCTQKAGKLNLIVWKWPDDGRLEVPIENKNVKAWPLAAPHQPLSCSIENNGVVVHVSAEQPDLMPAVVVLDPGSPLALAQQPIADLELNGSH